MRLRKASPPPESPLVSLFRGLTSSGESLARAAVDAATPMLQAAAPLASQASVTARDTAGRVVPLAQQTAARFTPMARDTASRVAPMARDTARRATPLARDAVRRGELVMDRVTGREAARLVQARRRRTVAAVVSGAIIGAIVAYFLDPKDGRRRRSVARDKTMSVARRGAKRTEQLSRYTSDKVSGVGHNLRTNGDHGSYNDPTLQQKIQSEILPDLDVDTSRLSVNVDNGVAILRGELGRPEEIRRVREAVATVPGLRGVESLLHLPNTPAPNTPEA